MALHRRSSDASFRPGSLSQPTSASSRRVNFPIQLVPEPLLEAPEQLSENTPPPPPPNSQEDSRASTHKSDRSAHQLTTPTPTWKPLGAPPLTDKTNATVSVSRKQSHVATNDKSASSSLSSSSPVTTGTPMPIGTPVPFTPAPDLAINTVDKVPGQLKDILDKLKQDATSLADVEQTFLARKISKGLGDVSSLVVSLVARQVVNKSEGLIWAIKEWAYATGELTVLCHLLAEDPYNINASSDIDKINLLRSHRKSLDRMRRAYLRAKTKKKLEKKNELREKKNELRKKKKNKLREKNKVIAGRVEKREATESKKEAARKNKEIKREKAERRLEMEQEKKKRREQEKREKEYKRKEKERKMNKENRVRTRKERKDQEKRKAARRSKAAELEAAYRQSGINPTFED